LTDATDGRISHAGFNCCGQMKHSDGDYECTRMRKAVVMMVMMVMVCFKPLFRNLLGGTEEKYETAKWW